MGMYKLNKIDEVFIDTQNFLEKQKNRAKELLLNTSVYDDRRKLERLVDSIIRSQDDLRRNFSI